MGSVCCVLGLKNCPKHQNCAKCVNKGLEKRRREGFVEGQLVAYRKVLEKSLWISTKETFVRKQMPEIRQYLREQIKECEEK